jgi:hypothetical protein
MVTGDRRRRRSRRVALDALVVLVVLAGVTAVGFTAPACDPKVSRVERGGECFIATDCVPGLVCIAGADRVRVCSDEIEKVAADPIDAGDLVSPTGSRDAGDAG